MEKALVKLKYYVTARSDGARAFDDDINKSASFDLNPNLHFNLSINEYKCLKNPKQESRVHMLLCLPDIYTF